MFRGITDESEIDLLVALSAKREVSRRWVADLPSGGASRPRWCRTARSDENELLAAHVFDSWTVDGEPGRSGAALVVRRRRDTTTSWPAHVPAGRDRRTEGARTARRRGRRRVGGPRHGNPARRGGLVSDTDQDNRAMRAAFARAGYIEFATRHDFHWRAPR